MKKKAVSMLLAATMVAGMFAGCGSDSNTSSNSSSKGDSTEAEVADLGDYVSSEEEGKVINIYSLIVSGSSAAICTYFSALTAYGLYTYDFKLRNAAFTFIMAILVMPTQVTAMGFLRLITKMGMYDTLWPLIIPSIASPAVFYFMYSYLQSSLPLSLQ